MKIVESLEGPLMIKPINERRFQIIENKNPKEKGWITCY